MELKTFRNSALPQVGHTVRVSSVKAWYWSKAWLHDAQR